MKLLIANAQELNYIGFTSAETTDKQTGATSMRYYLSVDLDGDVGKLPCSADVFNMVKDLPKLSPVIAVMQLDTFRKEFVVLKVSKKKEKKPENVES